MSIKPKTSPPPPSPPRGMVRETIDRARDEIAAGLHETARKHALLRAQAATALAALDMGAVGLAKTYLRDALERDGDVPVNDAQSFT